MKIKSLEDKEAEVKTELSKMTRRYEEAKETFEKMKNA